MILLQDTRILSSLHTHPWVTGHKPATALTNPGHRLLQAAWSVKSILVCVESHLALGLCLLVSQEWDEITAKPPRSCHSPLQSGQQTPQRPVKEQTMRHRGMEDWGQRKRLKKLVFPAATPFRGHSFFCVEKSWSVNIKNKTCILTFCVDVLMCNILYTTLCSFCYQ